MAGPEHPEPGVPLARPAGQQERWAPRLGASCAVLAPSPGSGGRGGSRSGSRGCGGCGAGGAVAQQRRQVTGGSRRVGRGRAGRAVPRTPGSARGSRRACGPGGRTAPRQGRDPPGRAARFPATCPGLLPATFEPSNALYPVLTLRKQPVLTLRKRQRQNPCDPHGTAPSLFQTGQPWIRCSS